MNNCVQCGVAIATDCENCVPKCTNCSNKCTAFYDTDCVWYNYNQPFKASELTCLGIASNTSLTTILKAIDDRMCTAFQLLDTYTVDLEWTGANSDILTANVRIDPASTIPYSIGPNGIKLDCCDPTQVCDDVTYDIDYSLGEVLKTPSFYNVLDPKYFTASQQLVSISVQDNTTMSGGTLTYLKYHNFLTGSIGFCNPLGSLFNLPAGVCAGSIIGKSGQMVVELATTPYCRFFKSCILETTRVEYSERYGKPVCYNPQFDEPPVFNGCLYITDRYDADVIRKWDLNDGRATTLSGNTFPVGPWPTISGSTGNNVLYDQLGSLVLDGNDILNNEPAIYTISKAGCLCRVFKAGNSACDERQNWITYVIAGADASTSLVDGDGTTARFYAPNGIKRVGTYNNAPILLISDRLNNQVRLAWFNGGNKNNAADWEVGTIPCNTDPVGNVVDAVAYFGSSYANINVDINERKIFTFYEFSGNTIIGVTELDPGMDMNDPADYLVAANLDTHYALFNTTGTGASMTPTDGSGASAQRIFFLSKINHTLGAPNGYCYVYCEWDVSEPSIYLNAFYCDSASPTGPSNYQYQQLIANNSPSNGNIGLFASVANACCYGLMHLSMPAGNTIVDYGPGGFREFDFTAAEILSVLSGAAVGSPNETAITGAFYDTQYEIVSTC